MEDERKLEDIESSPEFQEFLKRLEQPGYKEHLFSVLRENMKTMKDKESSDKGEGV